MARDFNENRNVNARLVSANIDKFGKTFAIQSPWNADGFSSVNVTVEQAPSDIKQYLEGDDSITVYPVPSNVDKLCAYALASFPNIEDLYLFKTSAIVVLEDDLSYLLDLNKIYVPTDLLSAYQSAYPTLSSKFDIIVEDYTLTIPFVGDTTLTSEYIDSVIAMLSVGEKNAITKLVIPTDFTQESAVNIYENYDWSVLPNLNDNIWYGTENIKVLYGCHISNLGSENPTDVVFEKGLRFPTENRAWEEVTINGNVFAKFTKMYKKVIIDENNNIKEMYLNKYKLDNDYHIYDCFLNENGNELDYILIGRYCYDSTQTANSVSDNARNMSISTGRNLARNLGTGYQLFDCATYIFWRDLALAVSENINFNNGSTAITEYMGLKSLYVQTPAGTGDFHIDGVAYDNGQFLYSNKPSKYVNEPTSSTDGYNVIASSVPNNGTIKELGYDSNFPTINLPSTSTGVYDEKKYYCDNVAINTSYGKIRSNFGQKGRGYGLFFFLVEGWSAASISRLVYRPINN